MTASPVCWARYGLVLAREYSDPRLLQTHRLSVDAYAVQHPGGTSRRSIQSVGLHLARLMLQLEQAMTPKRANDIMLLLGREKATLPHLRRPVDFPFTVKDVPLDGTWEEHAAAVLEWASTTWERWHEHHAFVRAWTSSAMRGR